MNVGEGADESFRRACAETRAKTRAKTAFTYRDNPRRILNKEKAF